MEVLCGVTLCQEGGVPVDGAAGGYRSPRRRGRGGGGASRCPTPFLAVVELLPGAVPSKRRVQEDQRQESD